MVSRVLSWVLPVVAGVASGLVGALVFSPRTPSTTRIQAAVPAQPPVVRTVYLASATSRVESGGPATASSTPERNPDYAIKDPVALDDEATGGLARLAQHENAIAAHQRQSRDARWARASEASLRADLGTLSSAARFEVEEVDCRSTSCISTVRWPNHSATLASWPELLHANYQLGCAREITLPDPADVSQSYRATVVFNCQPPRNDIQ